MRVLVLCVMLLIGFPALGQQPKELTNSIGMKLVLIPDGQFIMGSPKEEEGRTVIETQHDVTLSKSFCLGACEVTQGQYETVIGENPSRFKGSPLPVQNVSWEDAVAFCTRLSELPEEKAAGRDYRLPTEAEWEYACRAGSKTAFCFGDSAELLKEYAWYSGQPRKTPAVGEKKANAWGLYDMHGGVREWCLDWFEDYRSDAATDPQGPASGIQRICRGGCWLDIAINCRSANRFGDTPTERDIGLGFRVALGPPSR